MPLCSQMLSFAVLPHCATSRSSRSARADSRSLLFVEMRCRIVRMPPACASVSVPEAMNARARGDRLRARYAYLHELRLESRAERRVEEGRDRGQVRRDGAADDVRDFQRRHDAQEEELRGRVGKVLSRRGVREVLEEPQPLRLRRAVPFARERLHRERSARLERSRGSFRPKLLQ